MSKRKPILSVEEADQKLAELLKQAEEVKNIKAALIKESRSLVGDVAVTVLKSVPTTKDGCKNYFSAVRSLIERHADEFNALQNGGGKVSLEKPAPVESGNHRLPNNAAPMTVPVDAPADAEAGE